MLIVFLGLYIDEFFGFKVDFVVVFVLFFVFIFSVVVFYSMLCIIFNINVSFLLILYSYC